MSAVIDETETGAEFKTGDLVWAKLGKHPSWPAMIIRPLNRKEKENHKYVLFFATNDHNYVKNSNLLPYEEYFEKLSELSAAKDARVKIAVEAVKLYKQKLSTNEGYPNCPDEISQEYARQHWLTDSSKEAAKVEKDKNHLNLKRKKAPGKDKTQSSLVHKKAKISPPEDVRKESKPIGKPGTNKYDLKKKISGENSAHSRDVSKKPKIALSTKDSKKASKHSKKSETKNKTGKDSSEGNSVQPRKASAKSTTSASANNLRREQKRTPKPQVIVKKSKIHYLASSGSSFIFPGPSTSSRAPEIPNGPIVYDLENQSKSFIREPLQPVSLTLGFVGIGELASVLVSHLVKAGIHVLIWNRTASKCSDLVKLGAVLADTPADLAAESDIVFCSVRGLGPITEVCFGGLFVGLNGIVPGLKRSTRPEKGFVMLSSIKPETSLIIAQDFRKVCTKYLEVQVLLQSQSKDCDIRLLCAGSRSLFEKLPYCFSSTKAQFIFISCMLGEASRMKYAHTITHVGYALSLIEALAVLQDNENPVENLSFILDELDNTSPIMRNKIKDIIFHRRDLGGTIRELKDTLKDLYEWYPKKPLHLATAAYEALEYASRKGAENKNISAMYDLLV